MTQANLEMWPSVLLDSVATRKSGHTPNKAHGEFWNGGIKWVSLADSSKLDDRYIDTTDKQISALGIKNSSAVLLPAGTVILSRDAGVGKSAILAEEMAVSQHFMAWICDERKTHNLFLYYWLQHKKPEFESIATGSTIKTIGLPYFKKLTIALPPFEEQCRIASILSQWDDSLSVLSRLIDAKRRQKRGLAEQLLTGKRRLPGFEEEWEESTMGTVFSRVRRKNTEGNDHALTISGVHGLIDQREFFNKRVAAKDLSGYYLLRRGEFAYNKSYSTGYDYGAIKRLNRYEAGVVSTLYICFALQREDAVSDFYEHFFEANLLNEGLAGIAQEGARNHGLLNVSVVDFFELPVPFPPPAEQQAIAVVLSTLDSEIAALEALEAKVAEQKRGLMDALLTGRMRVNVEEAS